MPDSRLVDEALLRGWPLPDLGSDKEERGRLVVVAGSRETPGAGLLSAKGAFRVGAGKIHSRPHGRAPRPWPSRHQADGHRAGGGRRRFAGPRRGRRARRVPGGGTVLLGPGFTDPDVSDELVRRLVPRLGATVVIDPLATAYVTDNHEGVAALDPTVVLTVNPDELARCLGVPGDEVSEDLEGPRPGSRRGRARSWCAVAR